MEINFLNSHKFAFVFEMYALVREEKINKKRASNNILNSIIYLNYRIIHSILNGKN